MKVKFLWNHISPTLQQKIYLSLIHNFVIVHCTQGIKTWVSRKETIRNSVRTKKKNDFSDWVTYVVSCFHQVYRDDIIKLIADGLLKILMIDPQVVLTNNSKNWEWYFYNKISSSTTYVIQFYQHSHL